MRPVLFEIPGLGIEIPGYGLALMIGFLLSIMWAARRATRSGGNPDIVLNCGFIALIGGVVGSRVMFVIHYWDQQFARHESFYDLFWAILDVRKGGLEVYGGVIACAIVVLVYLHFWRHSIRWYLDIIAPSAALGMAIGRIGCFLNGCCWGGVCDLPWAVQFPYGSPPARQQWIEHEPGAALPEELVVFSPVDFYTDGSAAFPIQRELLWTPDRKIAAANEQAKQSLQKIDQLQKQLKNTTDPTEKARLRQAIQAAKHGGLEYYDIRKQMDKYGLSAAELREIAQKHPSLPVHPTQLYSFGILLILALLLDALYWRRAFDGQVICVMFLIEPWTRWIIEILRADNPVDTAGFTISQFLAICISLAGLVGLFVFSRMSKRSPRAEVWEGDTPNVKASANESPAST